MKLNSITPGNTFVMPSAKRKFGDLGEREAEKFLSSHGYKILDRNYRIKNIAEIDIVAERGNKLFFCEVKTRDVKHETIFPIQYSINEKKRRNLNKACQIYLADKRIAPNKEWQVDAIFVNVDFTNNFHKIDYLENILWEEYY